MLLAFAAFGHRYACLYVTTATSHHFFEQHRTRCNRAPTNRYPANCNKILFQHPVKFEATVTSYRISNLAILDPEPEAPREYRYKVHPVP